MKKSQNAAKNGNYWLAGAVVLCAIGISFCLLSMLLVGASVSGSGCGSQCEDSTMVFVVASKLFLGLAIAASLICVIFTWVTQTPVKNQLSSTSVTLVNIVILIAAALCFAVLSGL